MTDFAPSSGLPLLWRITRRVLGSMPWRRRMRALSSSGVREDLTSGVPSLRVAWERPPWLAWETMMSMGLSLTLH